MTGMLNKGREMYGEMGLRHLIMGIEGKGEIMHNKRFGLAWLQDIYPKKIQRPATFSLLIFSHTFLVHFPILCQIDIYLPI